MFKEIVYVQKFKKLDKEELPQNHQTSKKLLTQVKWIIQLELRIHITLSTNIIGNNRNIRNLRRHYRGE